MCKLLLGCLQQAQPGADLAPTAQLAFIWMDCASCCHLRAACTCRLAGADGTKIMWRWVGCRRSTLFSSWLEPFLRHTLTSSNRAFRAFL